MLVHRGRKGERRSFAETDHAAAITAVHQLLRAPLIVGWDNLNMRISAAMRAFVAAHQDWLTVVQLPAYAPELNPVGQRQRRTPTDRRPNTPDRAAPAVRHVSEPLAA